MPVAKSATPRRPPRQSKLDFAKAAAKTPTGKRGSVNGTGNILNFFKKVEVEEQLFLPDPSSNAFSTAAETTATSTSYSKPDLYGGDNDDDDIENALSLPEQGAAKRRKLSHDASPTFVSPTTVPKGNASPSDPPTLGIPQKPKPKRRGKGGFLIDSDTDEDEDETKPIILTPTTDVAVPPESFPTNASDDPVPPAPSLPIDESCLNPLDSAAMPEAELVEDQYRDTDDIDGLFDDEEFEVGEEFRERRFMEQQARLEALEDGAYMSDDIDDSSKAMVQACPLCNASLDGVTSEQATIHVNACLDGNPLPLPEPPSKRYKSPSPGTLDAQGTIDAPEISKRFARAAVPRPGQANPIDLGGGPAKSTSAFSKLMSGHAEDSAWASAAASENASRGKQAYQRTCPFYKIMPGFFICVDAFRYGAVEGCKAYFLSHFHSDHYIGLTANWSHGPIYCSKVTASLVKNQLRTAAKYVKELEFEQTVEVPGTEGVTVTMIPANHCPGSSLFLFEKKLGNGPGQRAQRILHCGDFRACPAQVAHPLLKPETLDKVSGKTRQQKIDICYLDTTYLNPRYSFPPQNDVIGACADFCHSLAGDTNAANDALDALKRGKNTTSVSQYFPKDKKGSTAKVKSEDTGGYGKKDRLLVICGTYSIGKERICKAIAQALNTKIFASAAKIKICSQLGDPELAALMTSNPHEAQVHMQMLMEIRAETLQDYLDSYKPHFSRIVGFRPSGWNFRSPTTTAKNVSANTSPGTVSTTSILHGGAWRTRFGAKDFVAQRGSTREAMCFGVPYSEHSSFRELALFCMTLRIEKVVPTVNVGSDVSRKRMKSWTDRWLTERRKGGIVQVLEENEDEEESKGAILGLWDGKDGTGGGVYW
ncbi:DRMBL-domain-containing protein [Xylariaceae sp. FL1019]|nr:DRMBL-domain-containing protein [Xylariaceae sp. FL1019]